MRTDEEEAYVTDPSNEGTSHEDAQNARRRKSVFFLDFV